MKEDISRRLKKKGWNENDIGQAMEILKSSQQKKNSEILFLDSMVYWVALFIAIIGNLVVSIVLVPFLLQMNDAMLYFVLLILGLMFGALFNIILKDIEKIDSKTHVITGIFIPLFAIIVIYFMTRTTNEFIRIVNLPVQHDPLSISFVYALFFILPYLIDRVRENVQIEQP